MRSSTVPFLFLTATSLSLSLASKILTFLIKIQISSLKFVLSQKIHIRSFSGKSILKANFFSPTDWIALSGLSPNPFFTSISVFARKMLENSTENIEFPIYRFFSSFETYEWTQKPRLIAERFYFSGSLDFLTFFTEKILSFFTGQM